MVTKAGIDFQLNDDGTATATLSFVDKAGLKVATLPAGSTVDPPLWTPSSPAIVVTPSTDGLSASVAPAVPPVAVTGVIITVGGSVLHLADGSTVAIAGVTSEGIDVVGGEAASFSITLS